MRIVDYDMLQGEVARKLGFDQDALDTTEFIQIRDALWQVIDEAWGFGHWPDLEISEQRWYRLAYAAGITYAAGDEVWHPGSGAYYQALKATTGNAPASFEEDGPGWVTNVEFWALAQRCRTPEEWQSGRDYEPGDQVHYRNTGLVYQCHTAVVFDPSHPEVTHPPTSTLFWSELFPFQPTIAYIQTGFTTIGDMEGVYLKDPRKYPGSPLVPWRKSNDGLIIETGSPLPTSVWVRFMPRSPRFDGDVWSASEIYTPSDENGGDTGGGGGDEGGDFVDTSGKAYLGVEHLRTREFHEPTHLAYILYLASEGDGGDGWFFYDDASFLADDGVDTIKPHNVDDSDPGRWRRKS